MHDLKELLERNRRWSEQVRKNDPHFFQRLAQVQTPRYLWIGCSDSRVPANQIVDMTPGEVFVHRNVANVVVHADLNCLSVMQYAIDVLRVEHVIVCGHYGCGGVRAALVQARMGLVDNWLRHVGDVASKHRVLIESLPTVEERLARLCELNVIEQTMNVCQTTVVQDAWARGQRLAVHAWIYGLDDGLVRQIGSGVESAQDLIPAYARALDFLREIQVHG
jgi:carbonic anhydrase